MDEQQFWFEEVPENERYWFLVQWGPPPSRDAEQDERQLSEEPEVGPSRSELREARSRVSALIERAEALGFVPSALSPPYWIEIEPRWVQELGDATVEAPVLFTTREAAEEERRHREDTDPETYLDLVERYGEETINRAYNNTSTLRVLWMDRNTLLSKLEDADFEYVMVGGELKLRRDFMKQLRRKQEEDDK